MSKSTGIQVAAGLPAQSKATDIHSVPQDEVTHTQMTLFIAYMIVICIWLVKLMTSSIGLNASSRGIHSNSPDHSSRQDVEAARHPHHGSDNKLSDSEEKPLTSPHKDGVKTLEANGLTENLKDRHNPGETANGENTKIPRRTSSGSPEKQVGSGAGARASGPPAVTLDKFLSSAVMFGAVMFYFYACDYKKVFDQGQRAYDRDTFLFLVFIFFLVACAFTIKPNEDKILNREQTEEWKGWMQVMFVWYHYFAAKEWYNWIRVYIACYVWMTGFGNFSFFWVRADFSMWRMMKMMFRLNFLVTFVALITNNEYMLYYICAMHTYWFITVYVFMRVFKSWNKNSKLMAAKFAAYAVCNAIIFDIPGVSGQVFRPLWFILGLHDNPDDIMHEWSFRAGLDHWACFFGMLCAYNYPHFEALMQYLDGVSVGSRESTKKLVIRLSMGAGCVLLGILWYFGVMGKDKYAYNATHPYTSVIPIFVFIILRNIHPVLRSYHIHLFAWLGKITLETYLSQLHVYLLANARTLLVYLAGYPLLNFSLATILYLTVSHTLFTITNDSSNFLIPKDNKKLVIHGCCTVALFGVSAVIAYGVSMV